MSRAATKPLLRALVFAASGAILGAASGWLAALPTRPTPELHEQDFHVARPDAAPIEVTPDRPLSLLQPFGDFDLYADVELPAGGTLDVVLRLVEPRRLAGGDMPLFHGRFTVLRLSADGDAGAGPAFRTREGALFDAAATPGHPVEAGLPATLIVEARGRTLRANVAGVWHGPVEATDAHGMIAFVVRGGTALIHGLRVDAVPRPLRLLPEAWCALGGALLGVLVALRAAGWRPLLGLYALPVIAWLAGELVLTHLLPGSEPRVLSLVLAGLSGGPLAIACSGRRALILAVPAVLLTALAWEAVVRLEQPRLQPFEDPRLDATFGPMSGTAAFDALARRLRTRAEVFSAATDEPAERVLMLGFRPLLEGAFADADVTGPLIAAHARRELEQPVEVVVVPTLYAHVRQQVELLETFLATAFAPKLAIIALAPWEGEATERPDVVELLGDGPADADPPVSALLELWARVFASPAAPTDPARLVSAFDHLATLAGAHSMRIALVVDPAADPALQEVAAAAAERHRWQILELAVGADPQAAIAGIGDVVVEALRGR